jgi:hypothetical protein
MQPHKEDFFGHIIEGSFRSAEETVFGTWLAVFKKQDVEDLPSTDGHYIERSKLNIPEDQNSSFDLGRPPKLGKPPDSVLSLEVAHELTQGARISGAVVAHGLTRRNRL